MICLVVALGNKRLIGLPSIALFALGRGRPVLHRGWVEQVLRDWNERGLGPFLGMIRWSGGERELSFSEGIQSYCLRLLTSPYKPL